MFFANISKNMFHMENPLPENEAEEETYHSWKFQENSKSFVGVVALFVDFLPKFTSSTDISWKPLEINNQNMKQKCSEWWVLHACQISCKSDYF